MSKPCKRLAGWTVVEDHPKARMDVAGASSKPIGTDNRFGQLWVAASSTNQPAVAGTNFWAHGVEVGAGTQQVVAAIRDAAGNVGRATNAVLVRVATAASYGYSAAGCVTNISYGDGTGSVGVGLMWNGQYQLTAAATNGSAAEQYGYDALGRRIWTSSGGVTTYSVYDGAQVIADVTAGGTLLRSYTWGPGIDNLLALTVHTGATARTYYALKDHLGSVHALVDAVGNVTEQYRFDAWGRTTVYDEVGNPLAQSAIGNRYVWQGREISWATGLYYFRARWYDPVTGRWLSNDPIGISGGLNQYVFIGNNPVNFRDPLGLCKNLFPWMGVPSPWQGVPSSGGGANIVNSVPLGGYSVAFPLMDPLLVAAENADNANKGLATIGFILLFVPGAQEVGAAMLWGTSIGGVGIGAAQSYATDSLVPLGTSVASWAGGAVAGKLALEVAGLPAVAIKGVGNQSRWYSTSSSGRYISTQVGQQTFLLEQSVDAATGASIDGYTPLFLPNSSP